MDTKSIRAFLFWFVSVIACQQFIPDMMDGVLDYKDYDASSEPPWYFIINDFKDGIASTIAFVINIVFAFLYFDKKDTMFYFLLFFTFISLGRDIGDMITVFLNTSNILNPEFAQTTWTNFEQYLNNPWKSYLFYIYLFVAVVGYLALRRGKTVVD